MSAILPLVHVDCRGPRDEEDYYEDVDNDGTLLEEGGSPLLHSTDTLEYADDKRQAVGLEMLILSAGWSKPEPGETLGTGGETLGAGGETLGAGGETLVAGGETLVAGGETLVAGGETLVAGGETLVAGGETLVAGGETLVAGGETLSTGGKTLGTGGELADGDPLLETPPPLLPHLETPPPLLPQLEASPPLLPHHSVTDLAAPGGSRTEEPERAGRSTEEGEPCPAHNGAKPLEHHGSPEHQPLMLFRRVGPSMGTEWPDEEASTRADGPNGQARRCCTRSNLKATAALAGALLVYPCFLYGAYVFLPFDVPLMPDLNSRIIYTLRCSTFATVPIVMGIIVYGLARLCSSSVDPFGKRKDEVEIHLRFITDSIHLFLLFFVNLLVLATYIPHEVLKLLPLLTAAFALARLIYWLTFAISSTFRGFGYGLTFFPILGLLICNLCYMFVLAPDKMFTTALSEQQQEEQHPAPRQRFWG